MMPCRLKHLQLMLNGLQKTGVSLVEFDGTQLLSASGIEDDCGIYILIPKLALWLQKTIGQSVDIFLTSIALTATTISLLGFFKYYTSWQSRIISWCGVLALSKICFSIHDLYIIPSALALAVVPWTLYYFARSHNSWGKYLFLFFSGAAIGTAHYIRAYSGIAALLFMVPFLIKNSRNHKSYWTWIVLALGIAGATLFFEHKLHTYRSYLHEHAPHIQATHARHPFWHIVYIGLGFITNDLGISYDDAVGFKKVAAIDPTIQGDGVASSEHYEAILQQETLNVIRHHPFYVVRLLVTKLSLILFYLLLFAHVGLLALGRGMVKKTYITAFFLALSWSSLPGLIAIPSFYYLSGFATFAGLLGIIGCHAFLQSDYPSAVQAMTTTKVRPS
jgi:hypothetical protein